MNDEAVFRWVVLAGLAVMMPVGLYHRLKARTGERLDRRQEGWFGLIGLRLMALLSFASLVAWLVNPSAMEWAALPLPGGWRWLGLGIGLAAGGLFFWTLRHLGKNLTDTVVTRQRHTLVTSGPYRQVRHPFYLAAGLAWLAVALLAANACLAATGLVTIMMLWRRAPIEEANLIARFGDDYRQYAQRTGRFFPRW